MKIAVLGAGAWGTALAINACARHDVMLWARDAAQALEMQATRRNARYLPHAALPAALHVTHHHDLALTHAANGLTVIATPTAGLREQLHSLHDERPTLWLCKGFEAGGGWLGHEISRSVRPRAAAGVLSGPSFADEVARGQPTALVAASGQAALTAQAVAAFHSEHLRIYTSIDVVGVEVGGAVKNVLAIAVGMLDGLAASGGAGTPGLNARAALITRGLAEMTRLGVALGASADTFMGLSGLGDLVLTATGDLSRNRRVGLRLAAGLPLHAVLAELGHVAEGVYSAPMVLARAHAAGVEMPITAAMSAVLDGRLAPSDAMGLLMTREARSESSPHPALRLATDDPSIKG
jgi:glycerol-3-phosphate dehydrogenase (NAD(P)+)